MAQSPWPMFALAAAQPPCAFVAAARKARRESGSGRPRGAKRSRSRKKPVSRNASAISAGPGAGVVAAAQERRQRQQPVAPLGAGGGADRATALGRDVDQVLARAGRRAAVEVERETAFGEDARLDTGDQRRRQGGVVEPIGDQRQPLDRAIRGLRVRAAGASARRASRSRPSPARCRSAAPPSAPAVRRRRRRDVRRACARQTRPSVLPGCSAGCSRDERPPRTRPR